MTRLDPKQRALLFALIQERRGASLTPKQRELLDERREQGRARREAEAKAPKQPKPVRVVSGGLPSLGKRKGRR